MDSLSGFWGTAFLIVFVMGLIVGVVSIIFVLPGELLESETFSLIAEIIVFPFASFMYLGLLFCMLKFSRNDIPYVRDLFRVGRYYPKFLLYSLIVGVYTFLCEWLIEFLIVLIIAFARYTLLASFILSLMTIACAFWFYVFFNGFFLIPYLIIDNPKMKFSHLFKMSWRLMKDNKVKLLLFQLSFLGWGILCLLLASFISYSMSLIGYNFILTGILPFILIIVTVIGFLLLTCYFHVAQCTFYNHIISEYKATLHSSEPADPDTSSAAISDAPQEEQGEE